MRVTPIRFMQSLRGLQHHRTPYLRTHQNLAQLSLHERHLDETLTKSAPVTGHMQCFSQGATHQTGSSHTVGQAGVVDHVRHLLEAAAALTYKPGIRAFEADFSTR